MTIISSVTAALSLFCFFCPRIKLCKLTYPDMFENPIIPGFSPDPSVIFLDGTFFLVTSSFHIFPGLPIYASKDLKSWTHIGNAINRPGQLKLSKATTTAFGLDDGNTMVATAGLWAPTIRYHKGTFYIVCTNCTLNSEGEDFDTANFYISTKDIWSDSWSDPIYFEFNGIDPSIFFDDDDRAYIQGSWRLDRTKQPSCTIKQLEIDIATGIPLSETKEIWEGFAKRDSEGPHIYKKDGWYYLVIAEGGTFEYHLLSVARSKNVWGPYESYEKNPILTAYGSDEAVQNTGHGELFQDGNGAWWATVLGVRQNGGRIPLGRETFLTPVTWPVDGWPQIDHPQLSFDRINSPPEESLAIKQLPHIDDVYIRDPVLQDYEFSSEDTSFSLRASSTDLSSPEGATSFLGKRQRALDETASAILGLEKANRGKSLRAGLSIFKDDYHHAEIFFDYIKSEVCFGVYDKGSSNHSVTRKPLKDAATVAFKISATVKTYEFLYREESNLSWSTLGTMDTLELTARDFTGAIFGVFASGREDGEGKLVSFKDFIVSKIAS